MCIRNPHRWKRADVIEDDHIGRYREKIGWGKGRAPGSLTAVGPEVPRPVTT